MYLMKLHYCFKDVDHVINKIDYSHLFFRGFFKLCKLEFYMQSQTGMLENLENSIQYTYSHLNLVDHKKIGKR